MKIRSPVVMYVSPLEIGFREEAITEDSTRCLDAGTGARDCRVRASEKGPRAASEPPCRGLGKKERTPARRESRSRDGSGRGVDTASLSGDHACASCTARTRGLGQGHADLARDMA